MAASNIGDVEELPQFQTMPDNRPVFRRAVFSRGALLLQQHHLEEPTITTARRIPRRLQDNSLKIIDELTNRSVDPLFSDSLLMRPSTSKVSRYFTHITVYAICVVIGIGGAIFVRDLQVDSRKKIRQSLAAQIEEDQSTIDDLTKEITDLRKLILSESDAIKGTTSESSTQVYDDIATGSTQVSGEGISITLTNSIAKTDASSSDSSSSNIRVITDTDLQQIVSLLWSSGAEAIAINGSRLGTQTSIRTAGQTIMVGTTRVENPYIIAAIGNKDTLSETMSKQAQSQMYSTFAEAGISIQVSTSKSLTLSEAVVSDISYASRSDE